jgi:NitT/TauT family transport system substrate-binding protein
MRFVSIAAAALLLAGTATSRAEIGEITIAQQFGVSFLPLMLMERDQLIEKHAKAAGRRGQDQLAEGRGPERDQ